MRSNKTISIDDATRDRLRRLAEVTGSPQSAVIEDAVRIAAEVLLHEVVQAQKAS